MAIVFYATPEGSALFGAIAADIDEIFIAGVGNDTLSGDRGDDSFVFQAPNGPNGGYGGSDLITDFEAFGGSGDTLKLRNISNGTRVVIRDLGNGSIVEIFAPNATTPIQTITLPNATAYQLLTQGQVEVNGQLINETTRGIVQSDLSNFSYTVERVAGNAVIGNGNNLVTGGFISPAQVNVLTDRLAAIAPIIVPGAARSDASSVNLNATGSIPDSLLPKAALNLLQPANAPATVNDDSIVGGAGNDLLVGGPGNDTVLGGLGTDVIVVGPGEDVIDGGEGVDYYAFESLLDLSGTPARINYVRLEPPYGAPLTDPLTARTGPDVILINSQAFNLGIDPLTNPNAAARMGFLQPGTIVAGDAIAPNEAKNGQLKVGNSAAVDFDGPQPDDVQPLFYYSSSSGQLIYDRDGAGTDFAGIAIANLGTGIALPEGTSSVVPSILLYIY
ncbi:calcium-binding protein [Pseudanabaena sp. PCC 6802]|uniref:calcium-binding protein n=1 Tax=Pseudanabaena sp. PCC 6802 TaxID=118173 RepID=UPI00034C10A3|nr:calcium-binding protein [Pseudanabaena sp. PCC 6802]